MSSMNFRIIIALGLCLAFTGVQAEEELNLSTEINRVSYSVGLNLGNHFKRRAIDADLNTVTEAIRDVYAGDEKTWPEDTDEKMVNSYNLGLQIGQSFKRPGVEVELSVLKTGMEHALEGQKPLLTLDEIRETLVSLQRRMNLVIAEKNQKEGEIFLAENKRKPDVVTLPSGLQYEVIEEGAGASPNPSDRVTVHYRGTFVDGAQFDSSYQRNEPAVFQLNRVIEGWQEGLRLMKPGAKWRLFVPSHLAYKEAGNPAAGIGPHATLLFDVELISAEENLITSDIIKIPSAEELEQGKEIEIIRKEDLPKR
jgi:FKBP-type peptidyl-prolyl cis-trans isomerase FklB